MATLKDIACLTGLSANTVSRALRGEGYLAPETLRTVREAAEKLHYRPSSAARFLRTGKSSEIAVILDNCDALHIAKSAAVKDEAGKAGFQTSLHICDLKYPCCHPERIVADIMFKQCAGAVFIGDSHEFIAAARQLQRTLPISLVTYSAVADIDCVCIDRFQGVSDAVHYLYAAGRRRIAYAGLPRLKRHAGYLSAVRALGLEEIIFPDELMKIEEIYEYGIALARRIDTMPSPPDAIHCSDYLAGGLLAGFAAVGRPVPEAMAIIGFDDRDFAALLSPPLTSVSQPNTAVGVAACHLLLDRISAPDSAGEIKTVIVPMSLTIRKSV